MPETISNEQLLTDAKLAMSRARIALMERADSAFFTALTFSMQTEWTTAIPTAAASHMKLYFNPKFFMDLSKDERVFLLLHETLHVALMHVQRAGEKDQAMWNKAADYVINLLLVDKKFSMPKGGLHDNKYRDMSTEQVYKVLETEPPSPQSNAGGPGDFGEDIIPDGLPGEDPAQGNPLSQQEKKDQLDDMLVKAKTIADMANDDSYGSSPGELQIYLDGLLNPRLPWQTILRRFMHRTIKADYSFRKPNRRYFPDHILPSQASEGMGELAIAVDTSGSVTDEEFKHFVSETHDIVKRLKPSLTRFIQFDTRIKSVSPIKSVRDLMNLKFTGRGGTNIAPVIEWAKDSKPTVLIIFTDGYFSSCHIDPKCPIIWVINGNKKFTAPHGQVIEYSFN